MNDNKILSVFRRLARRNSRIVAVESSAAGGSHERSHGVEVDGVPPAYAEISQAVLRAWLSDGRVEPCEGGYRIAPAGVKWLRRRLAEGDGFQEQHQPRRIQIIDFEGVKQPAALAEPESPLRWLASRKGRNGAQLLSSFQVEAGERLRADYEFAGITARVTASWSPAGGGGEASGQNGAAALQDNVMAARQRVVRALAAVGPELSGVLVDVCCHAKGLEEAEKVEGWPQRSGKVVLQIALTRLARHYGLVSEEQLSQGLRRKLLHWGAEDYRPAANGDGEAC